MAGGCDNEAVPAGDEGPPKRPLRSRSTGPVGRHRKGPAQPVPRRAVSPAPAGPAPSAATQTGPVRLLRAAIVVLLVLGVAGFLVEGAGRPADPRPIPAPDPGASKDAPGMGSALLSVSGARSPVCVLEAVTTKQQNFGLMRRSTLTPYAGMAFVFGSPTSDLFYMKDTIIPLSIAWFDGRGRFEAQTLMPPCPPRVSVCPTYGPGRSYSLAVEVAAGRLAALGIGPGSTAHLGAPCA